MRVRERVKGREAVDDSGGDAFEEVLASHAEKCGNLQSGKISRPPAGLVGWVEEERKEEEEEEEEE